MCKNEASSQISHRPALGCRYEIMFCCEKGDDSAVPFLSLAEEGGVSSGKHLAPNSPFCIPLPVFALSVIQEHFQCLFYPFSLAWNHL